MSEVKENKNIESFEISEQLKDELSDDVLAMISANEEEDYFSYNKDGMEHSSWKQNFSNVHVYVERELANDGSVVKLNLKERVFNNLNECMYHENMIDVFMDLKNETITVDCKNEEYASLIKDILPRCESQVQLAGVTGFQRINVTVKFESGERLQTVEAKKEGKFGNGFIESELLIYNENNIVIKDVSSDEDNIIMSGVIQ